jgi:tRNA(Ile)-lysidine synthase
VVLACSGGADSTYLALAWRDYAAKLGAAAPRAQVWVVDHGHRAGTAAEAELALQLYQDLGFEARVLRARPVPQANPRSTSVDSEPMSVEAGSTPVGGTDENSLRQLRYGRIQTEILAAPSSLGIFALLTAHHADDQAETVLLRILRGTGLRGLAGIPARRPLQTETLPGIELRRPLLAMRASEIRRRLNSLGQRWIEDPSNSDPSVAARNRLRQEVMPLLSQIATGDPASALLRLNSEAAEWRQWLEQGLSPEGNNWSAQWKSLPAVLRREAIGGLLRQHGHTVSPTRLQNLESALLARGSAAIDQKQRLSVAGGVLRCLPISN